MRDMKDSGITFVGNIPNNWKVLKNKRCFELEKDIVGPKFKEYQLLSLTKKGVILKDINNTYGKTPESYETYQSVKRGQLIMCLFDLDISAVFSGITDYSGMISPAYKIYNCKNNIYNRYAGYWFDFCFDGRKYMSFSKSLRYVVNAEDFKDIEIVVPPLEQQYKIVQFLDKKIKEIDNVIEKTRQTIEDYKLYKQSIITKAVTKGLDKNKKLKEVNIDWSGTIPEEWNVTSTLNVLSMPITDGPHTTPELFDHGIPFVSAEAISTGKGKINFSHIRGYISNDFYNECCKKYIPKLNDIYMIKSGATTGKISIVDTDRIFNIWSPLAVFRCNANIMKPLFLFYALQSEYYQKQVENKWTYGTQQNIGMRVLEKLKIIIPPITEQEKIIKYLSEKCTKIDNLIENKEKLIIELENYKKSLIYEYVTGKKEVEEKKIYNTDNINGIKINCKDDIFAQAILLCKIIERLRNYNLGRVKAEKTLYLIEKEVGLDFNNKYVREAAGPLSENLYKCESIISKNKWVNIKNVKKHIEYEILPNFNKYSKYYDKYFSNYDSQIEKIIDMVKNYSTDKAEMVATLYASWNDFIIKKDKVLEIEIVKDVRENWNDRKKRFSEREWLEVLEEMKRIGLTPKGNGNLTVNKE